MECMAIANQNGLHENGWGKPACANSNVCSDSFCSHYNIAYATVRAASISQVIDSLLSALDPSRPCLAKQRVETINTVRKIPSGKEWSFDIVAISDVIAYHTQRYPNGVA